MNFYTIAQEISIAIAGIIITFITCRQYLNKYFKKIDVVKLLPEQNKMDA